MFYKAKWEKVVNTTYRMKTPGGWLVFDSAGMVSGSVTLCHVPDPGHDWKFLPKEEIEDEQA